MRKQGLMKRVLGGVMAVAFGAALCFAAPMKAEAADLPDGWGRQVQINNDGDLLAYLAGRDAETDAINAKYFSVKVQESVENQLAARVAMANTTAMAQNYLATLGFAKQAASLVPYKYGSNVIAQINTAETNLRNDGYSFYNKMRTAYNNAVDDQIYYTGMMKAALESRAVNLKLVAIGQTTSAMYNQSQAIVKAANNAIIRALGGNSWPY